ncbi:hypothetical protein [Pseudovibrio sp. Ad26]|uniref:hypothetical protein n=1 Tax=Pseudovibrio sp. Ad26 TaxID=989410 RepID=UPI001AD8DCB3|nr:hypothetical protein [Pseudovibrio sp. Ad26]
MIYLLWLIPISIVAAVVYDLRRSRKRHQPLSYHSPNREDPDDLGGIYGDELSY